MSFPVQQMLVQPFSLNVWWGSGALGGSALDNTQNTWLWWRWRFWHLISMLYCREEEIVNLLIPHQARVPRLPREWMPLGLTTDQYFDEQVIKEEKLLFEFDGYFLINLELKSMGCQKGASFQNMTKLTFSSRQKNAFQWVRLVPRTLFLPRVIVNTQKLATPCHSRLRQYDIYSH